MNGNELVIVVCNITKMTAEYCHHTTTPDLPIREAVRMSIAVPSKWLCVWLSICVCGSSVQCNVQILQHLNYM